MSFSTVMSNPSENTKNKEEQPPPFDPKLAYIFDEKARAEFKKQELDNNILQIHQKYE